MTTTTNNTANTYHISVREICDWDDCPTTSVPVTIAAAQQMSTTYECKLWLMTERNEYLGTVVGGKVYKKVSDDEVIWRTSVWNAPEALRLAA